MLLQEETERTECPTYRYLSGLVSFSNFRALLCGLCATSVTSALYAKAQGATDGDKTSTCLAASSLAYFPSVIKHA